LLFYEYIVEYEPAPFSNTFMKKIFLFAALFFASFLQMQAVTGELRSTPANATEQIESLGWYSYTSNIVIITPAKGDTILLTRAVDQFFKTYKNLESKAVHMNANQQVGSLVLIITVGAKTDETRTMNNVSEIDSPKPEKG
jgi:hypothetical protein